MKAPGIVRTVILATALTFGASCKTPLVEGPRAARTAICGVAKPHPCTRKIIRGGLPSSSHILFQKHEDPLTRKITKRAVLSQILQYHILSDLIKNYGVRVVFLEGAEISDDVRQKMHANCGEKCVDRIQTRFGECVVDTALPCGDRQLLCRLIPEWPSRHHAEDFCLAWNLLYTYRLRPFPKFLLILENPSVFFTGVEKDLKALRQEVTKYRLLLRFRKHVEAVAGVGMGGLFKASIISTFRETILEPRNKQVDRDSINEIILRSSQNTALVVGVGHRESIESTINSIPFHKRPTFYLIMPECQNDPRFFVSPDAINTAAAVVAKTRTKQNL